VEQWKKHSGSTLSNSKTWRETEIESRDQRKPLHGNFVDTVLLDLHETSTKILTPSINMQAYQPVPDLEGGQGGTHIEREGTHTTLFFVNLVHHRVVARLGGLHDDICPGASTNLDPALIPADKVKKSIRYYVMNIHEKVIWQMNMHWHAVNEAIQ
jgi:hypothetical protein